MKRSTKVILLSLGTLSLLQGCDSEDVDIRQASYQSKEECVAEWKDEAHCNPKSSGTGYVGPHYFWNHSAGHPVIVGSNGATTPMSGLTSIKGSSFSVGRASVARGGFGVSAHSSAGG